jgi:hypothetical protein
VIAKSPPNKPLQRTNGSVASLPLPFAAERQYRWTADASNEAFVDGGGCLRRGLFHRTVVGVRRGSNEGSLLVHGHRVGQAGWRWGKQIPAAMAVVVGGAESELGQAWWDLDGERGSSRRPVQQAVAADVRSPGPLDGGRVSRARGLTPACPRDRVTLERDRRRTPLNGRSLDTDASSEAFVDGAGWSRGVSLPGGRWASGAEATKAHRSFTGIGWGRRADVGASKSLRRWRRSSEGRRRTSGRRDGTLEVNVEVLDALSNKPLQRMCARPGRSRVGVCREHAGWRPRVLATVLRSNATVGAHR